MRSYKSMDGQEDTVKYDLLGNLKKVLGTEYATAEVQVKKDVDSHSGQDEGDGKKVNGKQR